jgi:Domain of unknown function (DUF4113)
MILTLKSKSSPPIACDNAQIESETSFTCDSQRALDFCAYESVSQKLYTNGVTVTLPVATQDTFGPRTVQFAAAGLDKGCDMKQGKRSQMWTTCWEE